MKSSDQQLIDGGVVALEKAFDKYLSRSHSSSSCTIYENGKCAIPQQQVCFGALKSRETFDGHKGQRKFLLIGIQHYTAAIMPLLGDQKLEYYDYLMHRSPMREGFISKDPEKVLQDKYCIMSVDCPSNIMMCAMFAARHLWEKPMYAQVFFSLREGGVEEHLAFIMSQLVQFKLDNKTPIVSVTPKVTGHMTFHLRYFTTKDIKNYVDNTPPRVNPGSFADNIVYTGVDRLFTVGPTMSNNVTAKDGMCEFIKKNYHVHGLDSTRNNPFFKAVKKPKDDLEYEPYDQCIRNLITLAPILEQEMRK